MHLGYGKIHFSPEERRAWPDLPEAIWVDEADDEVIAREVSEAADFITHELHSLHLVGLMTGSHHCEEIGKRLQSNLEVLLRTEQELLEEGFPGNIDSIVANETATLDQEISNLLKS